MLVKKIKIEKKVIAGFDSKTFAPIFKTTTITETARGCTPTELAQNEELLRSLHNSNIQRKKRNIGDGRCTTMSKKY